MPYGYHCYRYCSTCGGLSARVTRGPNKGKLAAHCIAPSFSPKRWRTDPPRTKRCPRRDEPFVWFWRPTRAWWERRYRAMCRRHGIPLR